MKTRMTYSFFIKTLLFLSLIFLAIPAPAQTYDWLRSSVNQFWYNQFAGECKDNFNFQDMMNALSEPRQCYGPDQSLRIAANTGTNVVTDAYFDEALVEQAKQNQCQFNYWSALNTKDNPSYKIQAEANKKLKTQFNGFEESLSLHSFNSRNSILGTEAGNNNPQEQAQNSQKRIVGELVEQALKIAAAKKTLRELVARKPIYTADPSDSSAPEALALTNQIAILENSFLFSEDAEVSSFVKYDMVNKINEAYGVGKEPDANALKEFFYSDKKMGFQTKVVDKKMDFISNEQKKYSNIDGKYEDNYAFKVATVQSGIGAKILDQKKNQNPMLARIQCDLDAKYGKGEKIASVANSTVIVGATVFVGGASLLLARLAQIGMATQRAAKLAQVVSTITNSSITAGEIAKGFTDCVLKPNFNKKDSNACSRVDDLKSHGMDKVIDTEIDHSMCLSEVGLAALAGAATFKSITTAKRLQREKQLLELGIREKYNSLVTQIKSDPRLMPSDQKSLLRELDRSIALSSTDGFPRKEFIESLAKESPQELQEALKQINTSVAGPTWTEKVRSWISSKKDLSKEEKSELEGCLIENTTNANFCNDIKNKNTI